MSFIQFAPNVIFHQETGDFYKLDGSHLFKSVMYGEGNVHLASMPLTPKESKQVWWSMAAMSALPPEYGEPNPPDSSAAQTAP